MKNASFDPLHIDLKSHAASGFVFSGLAQATKLLTQFVSVVVMSRLLEPSDFGLMAMVSPVYAFAIMFHDLGLSQATMQKHELTSEQLNSFFWINAGLGIFVSLVLIVCSPLVGAFYGDPRTIPLTVGMAMLIFIGGFGNQHGALMMRQMRFREQAIINIISAIAGVTAAIAWGLIFGGYWSLYVGMAVNSIIAVVGVWLVVKWRPGAPALVAETLEMLKYGLGITSSNLTNFIVGSANNILVGRVLGDRPLGLLDRASRLLSSPLQQMIFPISGVIVPILYRLHDDNDRYRKTFLRTVSSLTFAISPFIIWAVFMSDILVPTMLGMKWAAATRLFAALSLASLPQLINGAANWLFVTQGRSGELFRWSLFSGAASLIALVFGIFYGINGVVIASVTCQIICTPILWWYVCRSGPVTLKQVIYTLIPQATGCLAAALSLYLLRQSGLSNIWMQMISGGIISYAIAGMVVSAFPLGRTAIKLDIEFAKYLLGQLMKRVT